MDQVAHQAVVIQFILEMAANSQQDPRGCFRQFFSKAKVGGYKHMRLRLQLLLNSWMWFALIVWVYFSLFFS